MIPDEEGFLFPIVDTKKCINCKLCEKVCPMRHQDFSHEIKRTLCAKHIDNSVRQECSSGGVFALLSEAFVSLGGIVVDVQWTLNLEPCIHLQKQRKT